MDIDRNTIEGFARRVRKNLKYVLAAREEGKDVHVVTELTNSLLGLIVFPCEHFKDTRDVDFEAHKLEELSAAGWPKWKFEIGHSDHLDDLLKHLRNALSHRRVKFSSNDRDLENVEITFADRRSATSPDYWLATIRGDQLLDFALRLSRLIDRID